MAVESKIAVSPNSEIVSPHMCRYICVMKESITDREFTRSISLTIAGLTLAKPSFPANTGKSRIRAIAFEGFPIFDPRPGLRKATNAVPARKSN